MMRRVAIVEVALSPAGESADNYLDQVYRVCREVLDKAGITREDVGTVVSASSDVFHGGVSCANAYYWDSGAAFLKNGTRQDGESLLAFSYAVMRILTGHYDTALVLGLCKGSENPDNDMITHFFTDPFYQRPLGLNETVAAGLQMRAYLEHSGTTEEQCARVVVKNLGNALRNPNAHRKGRLDVDTVLRSPKVMDPLKELECAPKSEGFVALLLASEDKAKKLTKRPVWFRGFGSSMDFFYLGDRDMGSGVLAQAAKRAYDMAGIRDPVKEIHVAEVTEPYAFQELLWYEGLGFCGPGEGGKFLDTGATAPEGSLPVNPSGGVLAANPYVSRGLCRLAEVTLQIRGQAGERQVDREVETGLAHGTHGFAGQFHAVAVVGA
ncbi:MAG: thiolase family protein [Deltaproteobacteria bacterium]|nr:thiolase family protein [Deltaproteobacteria bacterium]MBW1923160.1 thiolase family protein [Deltaproteobacteria bacterium]MBW1949281.1 thiolase family protein [Deltaproteobacteria bacterium]MBW2007715.1 thiolase family protein [Deltaproteobacteria bacterium]MBW2103401.1 thiolase family protein [Deltaproteobacteria bacterium]